MINKAEYRVFDLLNIEIISTTAILVNIREHYHVFKQLRIQQNFLLRS